MALNVTDFSCVCCCCCRYPEDGSRPQDTVPITTRQLEALIRLSQARAKACLREFVLEEDALDVVELMAHSVEQVHVSERRCLFQQYYVQIPYVVLSVF